ncbi:MAG: hypothetical protein Aurels2KO_56690 [Aureliella sp.]
MISTGTHNKYKQSGPALRGRKVMFHLNESLEDYEYVAIGSYQVEFFVRGGQDYFKVRHVNPRTVRHMLLRLSEWSTIAMPYGFELTNGARLHRVMLPEGGSGTLSIKSYFCGLLLYASYRGKVSRKGVSVINDRLSRHT